MTTNNEQRLLECLNIVEAYRVVTLADELCTAVDNAGEDIGGSRPIMEILQDLGPAVDAALGRRIPFPMPIITERKPNEKA